MSERPVLGGMVVCRPAPIPVRAGTEIGFRLMSDLHIGASHVSYRLIEQELKDALQRGDRVLVNGDVFDAILSSDKKRYAPDVIHPRIGNRRDILNAAIDWAVEIFSPVAHLIDMIGIGNHETAVEKHHSFDPVAVLVHNLSKVASERDPNHIIHYGGYTGFVDYRFHWTNLDGKQSGGHGNRWVIYYHHGSGGAAPVTKGIIDFSRKESLITAADLLWHGHRHNRLHAVTEKLVCPLQGDHIRVVETRWLMTGGYFRQYVGQSQKSIKEHGRRSNYAADAGMSAGGKGGARVVLYFDQNKSKRYKVQVVQ